MNEYLRWDPKDWDGMRYITVRQKQVWTPDLILKNNADANAISMQTKTDSIWLKYNGKNSWYPRVMIISSFKADVTDFPFDNQVTDTLFVFIKFTICMLFLYYGVS